MKSSILALLLLNQQETQAIPDFAAGAGTTAPTDTKGITTIDCHASLRSGHGFVSQDFYMVYDTTANRQDATAKAKNYLCKSDDVANCSDAYSSGTLKTDFVKASSFTDKQLALVACPQDEQICTPAGKTKTFADKNAAAIDVTMSAQAYTDICSFLIEATCDAPYVHIKDTGSDQSASLNKMSFSVIEYDPSFSTVNLDPNTAFTNAKNANAALKTDVAKYLK